MYANIQEAEKSYKLTEYPLNVVVEVTAFCNLNCVMCTQNEIKRPRGYMDIFLYKKIIDELAVNSPSTRIWLDFYGEPTLAGWKLYYMIDYAKKHGIENVDMNTNGTLLKPEIAEMLLDSGIDYISTDCDGFSAEVYESIRRGAKREVFYRNIEYLLKRRKERGMTKPIIDVKIIDMPENHSEVQQVLDYWRERGAWTAVRRSGHWAGTIADEVAPPLEERCACGHAVGVCAITWDGNVVTCGWDGAARKIYGNVHEESIRDIWARHSRECAQLHLNHDWDNLPEPCRSCQDWQLVGEERFDENGNPRNRVYDMKKALY